VQIEVKQLSTTEDDDTAAKDKTVNILISEQQDPNTDVVQVYSNYAEDERSRQRRKSIHPDLDSML